VAEGKVATLGVGGVLSCLDAETGKVVWRKDEYTNAVPQFFTGLSPIIVDGACIAHLGGKGEGAIIAFDLATGKEKWKWAGEGPTYDSPVLMTVDGTKQVVVFTEKSLVGIAVADGKLLWQVSAPPEGRNYNCATPVVDGSTVICTGQGRGTKAVKVEKQGDAFAAKEVWSNDQVGTGFNTPVLKGDLLFGLSDRGGLFCLDAKTGKTAWVDDKAKRDRFGSLVEAGPAVVALLGNSELVAFKAGGAGYEELAKIKVSDTPTYAHPVLSGNRIFVKDREAVTLWTLP
jgi:outer membrane protein assembly factor BamB